MKLVPKLSLAFILGTSSILAVNGYLRVAREVDFFESSRARDDVLIGRTLGAAMESVWSTDGQTRALHLIDQANAAEGRARVIFTWVPTDSPATRTTTRDQTRRTFVKVSLPSSFASTHPGEIGAIEVYEPLDDERAYIHRTIIDTVITALTLDAFCAALAMLLGAWIVGGPMGALMEKARRVGRGDFGGPIRMVQKDEVGELALEMNAMCDRLLEANTRIEKETRARIAMLENLRHGDRLMTIGKLASGIAHELGTPLNVVEARAQMIAARETSLEESSDYARIIVRATEQMTRIIRQLLAFARPRVAEKLPCDLVPIAERTIELLRPLVRKKQIDLKILAPQGACTVDADAGQMEQALTNLVVNAIHATQDHGKIFVTIDHARAKPPPDHGGAEADYARLSVKDEGAGMSAEQLAHVFEPFFTTKDVGEGTGLGLSVTYGIVREHAGWIAAESEVGKGATFTIHLPAEHGA